LRNFNDFTEKNYIKIIKKINNKCIFFDEVNKKKNFTLWRHDVDFSPHRALSLAKIENKYNIKSTYFILLGSNLYNIFEQEIKEIFVKILSFGHQLGLHFESTKYDIKSKKKLEKYLIFEKKILEDLFKIKIKAFSFHNPTKNMLKYDNYEYANMINVYSKYFIDNVKYCSDSNGYWRHQKIIDFLEEDYDKIQILTHPVWWQKKILSPFERVKRSIYGRSNKVLKEYIKLLKNSGRTNVK